MLDPRDGRRDLPIIGNCGAGDAGDRDIIDKARRMREDRRQARIVGRRRGEPDEIQPRPQGRQAEFLVFLGRQIDDDQPVDAGRFRVDEELRRRRRRRSDCNSP